jgi:hypothetical protein
VLDIPNGWRRLANLRESCRRSASDAGPAQAHGGGRTDRERSVTELQELEPRVARTLWKRLNAIHSLVYWDPEPAEELKNLGLRGWARYFASRSAALGPVSPSVVAAVFYGFNPHLVERALDKVWQRSAPLEILSARFRGVDRLMRRRLGNLSGADVSFVAQAVAESMQRCGVGGKPLFAAHLGLEPPEEAHLALWHAATLYREYRGDAHVAVLVAHGLGPVESLVLDAATGGAPADFLRANRGWDDEQWGEGVRGLAARGLVSEHGAATSLGTRIRERVEEATDAASLEPWRAFSRPEVEELVRKLDTLSARLGT